MNEQQKIEHLRAAIHAACARRVETERATVNLRALAAAAATHYAEALAEIDRLREENARLRAGTRHENEAQAKEIDELKAALARKNNPPEQEWAVLLCAGCPTPNRCTMNKSCIGP